MKTASGVSSERRFNAIVLRDCFQLNNRTHLEDRQVHGDNEATNEHTENSHDHRLEQAREVVYGIVDIFFVEVCDLGRHVIERTGFFTNRDHLDHHVREQVRVLHGLLQALTGRNLVTHFQHTNLVNDVARGTSNRLECFDKRHTGPAANIVDSVRA